MGAYSYKTVMYRDDFLAAVKPAMEEVHCTEDDYDGDPGYDGDGWIVADYLLHQKDKRIAELKNELDRYRNGFQGSCYACEVVGQKNVELEHEVLEYAEQVRDQGEVISLSKERLAEAKRVIENSFPPENGFGKWDIDQYWRRRAALLDDLAGGDGKDE